MAIIQTPISEWIQNAYNVEGRSSIQIGLYTGQQIDIADLSEVIHYS